MVNYMKKFFTLLLLLLVAAALYFGYAHFSGGAIPTWGLELGGERAQVRNVLTRFFENVRFKNLKSLPDFVEASASPEEIEEFLSQTFQASPSYIDLQSIIVTSVELDSTKQRARARIQLIGHDLKSQKPFDITRIIFLYRVDPEHWLIDIRNLAS